MKMELILLEKTRNLGAIGDRVKVKSGYGRNFLVPQGKAVYATAANIAAFEKRRAELMKKEAEVLAAAQKRAATLQNLSLTITTNAGEDGKLFGSIGPREISKAFEDAGQPVDKSEIDLITGPIRDLGEHEFGVQLHSELELKMKLTVVAEEPAK
jgi:large subunit ribosomal protein L9